MTATDRLNAMQQRCDAATEGPWETRKSDVIRVLANDATGEPEPWLVAQTWRSDAEFIAAARTDLPATIAALRAVLKVHAPLWTPSRGHYCQECSIRLTNDAPDCPTVRAITEARPDVTRILWHLIVKRHDVTRIAPFGLYVCECGGEPPVTRLTHALAAARELWHLATLAIGDWWENRLDEGDPDDQAWLESVLEQHAAYLQRENP